MLARPSAVAVACALLVLSLTACAPQTYQTQTRTDVEDVDSEPAADEPQAPSEPADTMSWEDTCILSMADINAVLEPQGIVVDRTEDPAVNDTDYPGCTYQGPEDTGTGSVTIIHVPYSPSQKYGFETNGTSGGWLAPDAATGYANACAMATAERPGTLCDPAIGKGYVHSTSNTAVIFLDGPGFYTLNVLRYADFNITAQTYPAFGALIAANG